MVAEHAAWWLQADGAKPGLALPAGTIFLTAAAVAADVLGDRDRARLALADATERAETENGPARRPGGTRKDRAELHDAVAHHLSLIAVRADAAPYRLAGLASEARAEFSDLGETAREAMTEMRRLLGVLRTGQAAEHAPQPQFADLPELVDAARDAGLTVELAQRGPVRHAARATAGSCAFRIVQESLSNAGRHAPGAAISVGVEVEPSIVRLKISNGPPASARNSTTGVNGRGHAWRACGSGSRCSAARSRPGRRRAAASWWPRNCRPGAGMTAGCANETDGANGAAIRCLIGRRPGDGQGIVRGRSWPPSPASA